MSRNEDGMAGACSVFVLGMLALALAPVNAAAYWTAFDQVFDRPPEPLVAILDAGEPAWMRKDLDRFIER